MKRKSLAEKITVVGSGASLSAGLFTAATSIAASALSIPLAPPVLAVAGIVGLVAGATVSYLFEDKILNEAEKKARDIEGDMSRHGPPSILTR